MLKCTVGLETLVMQAYVLGHAVFVCSCTVHQARLAIQMLTCWQRVVISLHSSAHVFGRLRQSGHVFKLWHHWVTLIPRLFFQLHVLACNH
jgi:hypothetical protein